VPIAAQLSRRIITIDHYHHFFFFLLVALYFSFVLASSAFFLCSIFLCVPLPAFFLVARPLFVWFAASFVFVEFISSPSSFAASSFFLLSPASSHVPASLFHLAYFIHQFPCINLAVFFLFISFHFGSVYHHHLHHQSSFLILPCLLTRFRSSVCFSPSHGCLVLLSKIQPFASFFYFSLDFFLLFLFNHLAQLKEARCFDLPQRHSAFFY